MELDLTNNIKIEPDLEINIFTKNKEVYFVFNGFSSKREAIEWAAIQHTTYILEEKERCTQH